MSQLEVARPKIRDNNHCPECGELLQTRAAPRGRKWCPRCGAEYAITKDIWGTLESDQVQNVKEPVDKRGGGRPSRHIAVIHIDFRLVQLVHRRPTLHRVTCQLCSQRIKESAAIAYETYTGNSERKIRYLCIECGRKIALPVDFAQGWNKEAP